MKFEEYFSHNVTKVRSSLGNRRNYEAVLYDYIQYGKDFDIYEEDLFSVSVKQRMIKIAKMNRHWQGFVEFLQKKGNKNSSIKQKFSKIKAIIKQAEKEIGVMLHIDVNVNTTTPPVFSWKPEFTKKFLSSNPSNKRVATAMKLQILTCFRPGDLMNLKVDNFIQEDDVYKITLLSQKTNTLLSPVINEKVWKDAYEYVRKGSLLPYRCSLYYGNDIKKVLEEVAPTLDVLLYKQDKLGKVVMKKCTIAEATTPHTLRKSGINLLLDLGVKERVIMDNYSGHKNFQVFSAHYVSNQSTDGMNKLMNNLQV